MSEPAVGIAAALLGYLLGSIPFGLLVARSRGLDIRQHGSGNIGATNVARNLGKKLGALVLLLDALKGAVPLLVVRLAGLEGALDGYCLPVVGWAAVAGHCFPVWLRFRGGKGVATALGVVLVADPLATLVCVVAFVLVAKLSHIVSLGSLAATAAFPLVAWALGRPGSIILLGVGSFLIVVLKHHENIARLLRGSENRL